MKERHVDLTQGSDDENKLGNDGPFEVILKYLFGSGYDSKVEP